MLEQRDVLIVDDDAAIRTMLCVAFTRRGLQCIEARNGLEALEHLRTYRVAVILLDVMMPRLDGATFLDQFSVTRAADRGSIIIAMSAGGDDAFARLRPDMVHLIVRKPFDVTEIAGVVSTCVAVRREQFPPLGPQAVAQTR